MDLVSPILALMEDFDFWFLQGVSISRVRVLGPYMDPSNDFRFLGLGFWLHYLVTPMAFDFQG